MGGSNKGGVGPKWDKVGGPWGQKEETPQKPEAILEQGGGWSQGESGPGDEVKILDKMIQT